MENLWYFSSSANPRRFVIDSIIIDFDAHCGSFRLTVKWVDVFFFFPFYQSFRCQFERLLLSLACAAVRDIQQIYISSVHYLTYSSSEIASLRSRKRKRQKLNIMFVSLINSDFCLWFLADCLRVSSSFYCIQSRINFFYKAKNKISSIFPMLRRVFFQRL